MKSRRAMRGHTDAASFPFRGQVDRSDARVAPSPDVVTLIGLKNPAAVPTTLMRLADILARLTPSHVVALQQSGFLISAQRTFQQGTKKVLGNPHMADEVSVLWESPQGLWVRYSHSHVVVIDEDDKGLIEAKEAFEAAVAEVATQVVLRPGGVLVVNNRNTLHGRGQVGSETGGDSRWLMRTYGLDTLALLPEQRYADSGHQLFP